MKTWLFAAVCVAAVLGLVVWTGAQAERQAEPDADFLSLLKAGDTVFLSYSDRSSRSGGYIVTIGDEEAKKRRLKAEQPDASEDLQKRLAMHLEHETYKVVHVSRGHLQLRSIDGDREIRLAANWIQQIIRYLPADE